jgi:uncharacterized protein
MKPFSLLVKPASADCNLACEYCFYLDRAGLYPGTAVHRMPDSVLEAMVRGYLATPQPQYTFGWQGGEPTLMGADFFRRATDLQRRHGRPGAIVANGLQTNGTLLDDGFAALLAERRFLVGLSLDGPARLHDRHRRRRDGLGSHAAVLEGLACLRRQSVEFNVLTLVSQANVRDPETVYRYLRDEIGCAYHQYIECVEFDAAGRLQPWAVDGAEWGEFLCRLFDVWFPDARRVSVRLFDTLLAKRVDGVSTTCAAGRDCREYFVVEWNGDVYPCDFYVRPDLLLGNAVDADWATLQASPAYEVFGARKRAWHADCDACPYLDFCNGDCPKNRVGHGPAGPRARSRLCAGWKRFFAHAGPRLEALARGILREREARTQPPAVFPPRGAPGRNDPCPCGSGRKFKKCCGSSARAGTAGSTTSPGAAGSPG